MNLEDLGGGRVVYFHNKIPCTALEKKESALMASDTVWPGVHGAAENR